MTTEVLWGIKHLAITKAQIHLFCTIKMGLILQKSLSIL